MIKVAHLLDDFAMGGVTQSLKLFEQPRMQEIAHSFLVPIKPRTNIAPLVEADVIVDHMAASWERMPFLASLRARNRKAHIVRVEHSYTAAFEEHRVLQIGRFRLLLRLSAMLANEVVCVSEAQRGWVTQDVGIRSGKVRTIYPWSGRDRLFQLGQLPRRRDAPLQLLAYGRFAEVKNFENLIRAMRSFSQNEVQLTLFGDGPLRPRLRAIAAGQTNVRLFGPQDDPSLWLRAADAVILPSRYEAFGLVATEARMAATPPIVADVDGLPEQAVNGGIVADLSCAYSIARAIRAATRAPLAQLGLEAREGVRSQHDRILDRWEELLLAATVDHELPHRHCSTLSVDAAT